MFEKVENVYRTTDPFLETPPYSHTRKKLSIFVVSTLASCTFQSRCQLIAHCSASFSILAPHRKHPPPSKCGFFAPKKTHAFWTILSNSFYATQFYSQTPFQGVKLFLQRVADPYSIVLTHAYRIKRPKSPIYVISFSYLSHIYLRLS